jgi:D-glycero-alpha-D-manno-heptose-7-phosphate kinase
MTRTPLRVSLFGGGTDYPDYFNHNPGAVIGFAIDKYIHIAALRLSVLQDYNYRVAYSKIELVNQIDEIQHPVVREVLRHFNVEHHLDISVMSDLPATGGGLGSSSAFTVGFVRLIQAIHGKHPTKIDVARTSIMVERDLLGENVGVQDQLHASFGGLNRFDFTGGEIRITPVQITANALSELSEHLVLVHTGIGRRASAAVADQVAATRSRSLDGELAQLYAMVGQCVSLLESDGGDLAPELGRMLNESWKIKRGLTSSVSNDAIDDLYDRIIAGGAYGAKLCGAGGGGYFMALVPPELQSGLADSLAPRSVVPVDIDTEGTSLIYPVSTPFSRAPLLRPGGRLAVG